jgi:histidine triad (HIT) family protein
MLSEEETEEIKQKLFSHIDSTFSEEQAISAKQQINAMNPEQLEDFLEKNKLIRRGNQEGEGDSEESSGKECVFCSIASGKIKSVKIDEDENAVAVLEINPISKGHALIIPKEHSDKSSKEALSLAKKVSKKIKQKFKPKTIEISKSKLFGHEVINLLPVYSNENFNSARKSAKTEELEMVREELEKKKEKAIRKKSKVEKIKEMLWLPKRIP